MTRLDGLNVIWRGGEEVVGKARLGRHYALSLWRDRKSDPVKGIIIRRGGRGEKDIRSKPIKGRDVCSCRGWEETDLSSREKINKCSCDCCRIRMNVY